MNDEAWCSYVRYEMYRRKHKAKAVPRNESTPGKETGSKRADTSKPGEKATKAAVDAKRGYHELREKRKQQKKAELEKRWAVLSRPGCTEPIGFEDIPFPNLKEDGLSALVGVDLLSTVIPVATKKKLLMKAFLKWHPVQLCDVCLWPH